MPGENNYKEIVTGTNRFGQKVAEKKKAGQRADPAVTGPTVKYRLETILDSGIDTVFHIVRKTPKKSKDGELTWKTEDAYRIYFLMSKDRLMVDDYLMKNAEGTKGVTTVINDIENTVEDGVKLLERILSKVIEKDAVLETGAENVPYLRSETTWLRALVRIARDGDEIMPASCTETSSYWGWNGQIKDMCKMKVYNISIATDISKTEGAGKPDDYDAYGAYGLKISGYDYGSGFESSKEKNEMIKEAFSIIHDLYIDDYTDENTPNPESVMIKEVWKNLRQFKINNEVQKIYTAVNCIFGKQVMRAFIFAYMTTIGVQTGMGYNSFKTLMLKEDAGNRTRGRELYIKEDADYLKREGLIQPFTNAPDEFVDTMFRQCELFGNGQNIDHWMDMWKTIINSYEEGEKVALFPKYIESEYKRISQNRTLIDNQNKAKEWKDTYSRMSRWNGVMNGIRIQAPRSIKEMILLGGGTVDGYTLSRHMNNCTKSEWQINRCIKGEQDIVTVFHEKDTDMTDPVATIAYRNNMVHEFRGKGNQAIGITKKVAKAVLMLTIRNRIAQGMKVEPDVPRSTYWNTESSNMAGRFEIELDREDWKKILQKDDDTPGDAGKGDE